MNARPPDMNDIAMVSIMLVITCAVGILAISALCEIARELKRFNDREELLPKKPTAPQSEGVGKRSFL